MVWKSCLEFLKILSRFMLPCSPSDDGTIGSGSVVLLGLLGQFNGWPQRKRNRELRKGQETEMEHMMKGKLIMEVLVWLTSSVLEEVWSLLSDHQPSIGKGNERVKDKGFKCEDPQFIERTSVCCFLGIWFLTAKVWTLSLGRKSIRINRFQKGLQLGVSLDGIL